MAGAIKRYWESTKNQLARYADVWRVACDMEAGGCLDLGGKAMHACDRRFQAKTNTDTGNPGFSIIDRKPAEVVPADLDACVRATEALRQCMQCKPDIFRDYIIAMEKGIEEDERMRREPDVEVEDGPRFRWWTGMRNS
jgi:hypothetical protein